MMTETQTLLAEYVHNSSEHAFGELLRRYIALVYSAALRSMNGDAHGAQDVTQTVFIDRPEAPASCLRIFCSEAGYIVTPVS